MTEQQMFKEYNEIIDKMLWLHNRNLWDDLRSEAYLKFTYVRDNWDPDKGRFFSFAYCYVETQMLNFIRRETNKLIRKHTYNTLDNQVNHEWDSSSFADLIEDYEGNFEWNLMIKDILEKNLNSGSDFEREVKRLFYIEGYTKREINVSLGLNGKHPRDKEKLERALRIRIN